MARTEEKVRSLIEEDPSIADALGSIVQTADAGDGEVEWSDVRDDISSGQWGRLIEKGVLVDGLQGFVIDDPEAVKTVLDDEDVEYLVVKSEVDEIEGTEWTQWDKAAAVGAVALFAGYAWEPARELAGNTMDIFLGPLASALPLYGVIMILALLTGLYSTLLQANLTNREAMGKYRDRMQAIQEKRKRAKEAGDEEALEQIQQEQLEAMGDQLGMFKEQFRPMVWIMFLTIPVFLWLLWAVSARLGAPADRYQGTFGEITFPLASGSMEWTHAMIWYIEPWIVWYFICSLAFTQVIRKSLNIQMTPSG